jgi:chemotaxis protein histidine kinase CheA
MSQSLQQLLVQQTQRLWPLLAALVEQSTEDQAAHKQLLYYLHTLKGSALGANQHDLAEACHDAESAILTGNFNAYWPVLQAQWLPVLLKPSATLSSVAELTQAVQHFFQTTAQQLGQAAALQSDIDECWLAEQDLLWEVLPHLLRNALSHGAQTEAERIALAKPVQQQVKLRATVRHCDKPSYCLVLADDGAGVAQPITQATLWQGRGQGVAAVRSVLLSRAKQLGYQARLRWRGRVQVGAVVRLSLRP